MHVTSQLCEHSWTPLHVRSRSMELGKYQSCQSIALMDWMEAASCARLWNLVRWAPQESLRLHTQACKPPGVIVGWAPNQASKIARKGAPAWLGARVPLSRPQPAH